VQKKYLILISLLSSMSSAATVDLYTGASGLGGGALSFSNNFATIVESGEAPYTGETKHLRATLTGADSIGAYRFVLGRSGAGTIDIVGKLLRCYLKADVPLTIKLVLFAKGKVSLISSPLNLTTSYAEYTIDTREFTEEGAADILSKIDYIVFVAQTEGSFTATLDIGKISIIDP